MLKYRSVNWEILTLPSDAITRGELEVIFAASPTDTLNDDTLLITQLLFFLFNMFCVQLNILPI